MKPHKAEAPARDAKLADLLKRLPGPDSRAVADESAAAEMERTLAEILKGGKERIVALVGLLVEPGKGDDTRARYALHALAVAVCRRKDAAGRRLLAQALTATLGGSRPKEVQAFVVRQVQVVGGKEEAAALGRLLGDADLCEPAAQALLAIRTGAAEQFRAALAKVTGKGRLTVAQALGVLRDGKSAPALGKLVGDADRDTRLAALWALANIGDAGSVGVVLKAADVKAGYERTKATQACLLLAERLRAAGHKREAARVYAYLKETRTEPGEKYVREAAERGLAGAR
jgi:hypothetical protein